MREWRIKLWCARNFGWKPDEVDQESESNLDDLLRIWGIVLKEEARQLKRNSKKGKR